MNLFGVGPTEIIVILIVILVLFGPDRLPEIAKRIGGASREIRDNLNSMNEQMNSALEASMDIEKAQMRKPAPRAVVDSTAQPVETTQAESIAPGTPAQPVETTQAESIAPPKSTPQEAPETTTGSDSSSPQT